jgi:hypothetical protein
MSDEATRRAPMMSLQQVVERYLTAGQKYGEPVALSSFALAPEETRNMFSAFDEDYHISRFLHFSRGAGQSYLISGEDVTHIAIDSAIQSIL